MPRPRRGLLLIALATVALVTGTLAVACAGDDNPEETAVPEATTTGTPTSTEATQIPDPTATPTNEPRPSPTVAPIADPIPVAVVPAYDSVVLERPVEVLSYPLGGYEIAIADQSGVVYGVREGEATPLLDLTGSVLRSGNEEGLLSVALDPQSSTNRHVWIYYSAADPRRTVLSRFTANADGTIDAGSELVVFQQEQPASNHNGGSVRFGPDRMLYLGLGDGGNQGDPQGNGQNLGTLLGTVIRIDVSQASAEEPYRVPEDNPFVGQEGVREEIFAYGLRNPWRMSFDPATGDLWLADVGQNAVEEVNRVQAGDNLGWNVMEGDQCYQAGCDPSEFVPPISTYARAGGHCSVTGGVVARDAAATAIEGNYIFGDYCSGALWAVRSDAAPGTEPTPIASGLGSIVSISQVGNQVYVVVFGDALYRLVDQ